MNIVKHMKKTNRIVRAMRERKEYVDYITSRIDVNVLYDTTGNAMETFLEALRMAGDEPCIHMEEDILLTSNFDENEKYIYKPVSPSVYIHGKLYRAD